MSLGAICLIAFTSVFVLLSFLAVAMQLITLVFPETKPAVEPAVVAAISGAVAAAVPGARVTRIEEER
jgi:hypothetical protein